MPDELCLGDARDLAQIIGNSSMPFDGRICVKCYYQGYNEMLATMLNGVKHGEFV